MATLQFFQSLAVGTGVGISTWYLTPKNRKKVEASDDAVHPPSYPWSHNPMWATFDHHSIRRGYKVFTQVCATCHGLSRVAYRNLVGVCLTEEEAKAEAAQKEFKGEPSEDGEATMRPGRYLTIFLLLILTIMLLDILIMEHCHQICHLSPRPVMMDKITCFPYLQAIALLLMDWCYVMDFTTIPISQMELLVWHPHSMTE